MIQLPSTTAEVLGQGGTVKFRSPCPVIVEQVGVGNVATLTGTDTFTATETGEYLFENTCDCKGFYVVLDVGDMTDGCCVAPVVDAGGALAGMTIAGVDYMIEPNVTYTWDETNPVDGDGIVVWTATGSDGSTQDITLAEPTVDTNTIFTGQSIVGGILIQTFTDVDGNPLPNIETDMDALISSPLIAGGGITVDVDPVTGQQTVSSTIVDTTTTMVVTNNPDGSTTFQNVDDNGDPVGPPVVQPASTDTNVSAVDLAPSGQNLQVTVTEAGTGVVGGMIIPDDVLRECGDKALVYDAGDGWVWKELKPDPRYKESRVIVSPASITGSALDVFVGGGVLAEIIHDLEPFVDAQPCYTRHASRSHLRLGAIAMTIGVAGDEWSVRADNAYGSNSHIMRASQVTHTSKVTQDRFSAGAMFTTDEREIGSTVTRQVSYALDFTPNVYTPSASNSLAVGTLESRIARHEVVSGA